MYLAACGMEVSDLNSDQSTGGSRRSLSRTATKRSAAVVHDLVNPLSSRRRTTPPYDEAAASMKTSNVAATVAPSRRAAGDDRPDAAAMLHAASATTGMAASPMR